MPHKYGAEYRRARARVLGEPCIWCGAPGTTGDHVPPLSAFPEGEWRGEIMPACERCNKGNKARRLLSGAPAEQRPTFGHRRGLVP